MTIKDGNYGFAPSVSNSELGYIFLDDDMNEQQRHMTGEMFLQEHRSLKECAEFLHNANLFIVEKKHGAITVKVGSPYGPTLCEIPYAYRAIAVALTMGRKN